MVQFAIFGFLAIYAAGIISLIACGLLCLAFPGFRTWLTGQPARSRWSYDMPERRQRNRGIASRSDTNTPETAAAFGRSRNGPDAGSAE